MYRKVTNFPHNLDTTEDGTPILPLRTVVAICGKCGASLHAFSKAEDHCAWMQPILGSTSVRPATDCPLWEKNWLVEVGFAEEEAKPRSVAELFGGVAPSQYR